LETVAFILDWEDLGGTFSAAKSLSLSLESISLKMELKPLILAEAFMVPMLIVFVLTVAIAAVSFHSLL